MFRANLSTRKGWETNLSRVALAAYIFSTPVEDCFFPGGKSTSNTSYFESSNLRQWRCANLTYSVRRLLQLAVFDWRNQWTCWLLKVTPLGALSVIRWLGGIFQSSTMWPPVTLHGKENGNIKLDIIRYFLVLFDVCECTVIWFNKLLDFSSTKIQFWNLGINILNIFTKAVFLRRHLKMHYHIILAKIQLLSSYTTFYQQIKW